MIMQARFTALAIRETEGDCLRRLIRLNWAHPVPSSAGFLFVMGVRQIAHARTPGAVVGRREGDGVAAIHLTLRVCVRLGLHDCLRVCVGAANLQGLWSTIRCSAPSAKGRMRVIALIRDPGVIPRILDQLGSRAPLATKCSPPLAVSGRPQCANLPLTYHQFQILPRLQHEAPAFH
jgi:hypothetical protein